VKVGDIVRVKTGSGYFEEDEDTTCYWPDAKGQIGMIISTGSFWLNCRPAAKIMILGEIAEFDQDELEVINEGR
jgi:hypothetical protein